MSIVTDIYFELGQCHTLVPEISIKKVSQESGFSLILTHDNVMDPHGIKPGWHIYIHETKDHFAGKMNC